MSAVPPGEVPRSEINSQPEGEWEDSQGENPQDLLFGDDMEVEAGHNGLWELVFHEGPQNDVEEVCFCEHPEILEWANLATGARKQRVEVQWRSLNEDDRKLFKATKDKEVKAWVDHATVRKVSRAPSKTIKS